MNNSKLNISRAVVFDKNTAVIKSTKSYAGERSIDIPSESVDFLKDYINGITGLYLFTKNNGELITKSSYDKMWSNIIRKMNLAVQSDSEKKMGINPISITSHYFRHNYCTLLYYSGLTIGKAVELMGHADYKMIMEIYKHLDDEKENTSDKINNNIRIEL